MTYFMGVDVGSLSTDVVVIDENANVKGSAVTMTGASSTRAAEKAMHQALEKAGLQMGFHNHHMEFEKRGGELIYDALLEQLDPDLVKMQFQVAVVNIGYLAEDYFTKYPGRFISAHLSDWKSEDESVPIGQGMVDWPAFFKAAKTGGMKNFFAEINPDFFEESVKFLLQE